VVIRSKNRINKLITAIKRVKTIPDIVLDTGSNRFGSYLIGGSSLGEEAK